MCWVQLFGASEFVSSDLRGEVIPTPTHSVSAPTKDLAPYTSTHYTLARDPAEQVSAGKQLVILIHLAWDDLHGACDNIVKVECNHIANCE